MSAAAPPLPKRNVSLWIPEPVPTSQFVCESCLQGSGCEKMFVAVVPTERRDCQSCGRPSTAPKRHVKENKKKKKEPSHLFLLDDAQDADADFD